MRPGAAASTRLGDSPARRLLRRLRILCTGEGVLFLRALGYCSAVRLALWAMPGSLLLRYVGRQVDGAAGRDRREASIERLVWSVRAAARRVPGTTCLVEALAAQLVLARNGQSSQLRIGVRRGADQEFSAHAWVQVNGRIVIGARPGEWYYPLPDLDPLLRRGVRG